MAINLKDNTEFERFKERAEKTVEQLSAAADAKDADGVKQIIKNFNYKVSDFYRDERKLNIGVIGQVKAGKSSFLNTLLFGGKDVLPKAATPKTATLTKMEYSEENIIQIEYYDPDEWSALEDNAAIDSDDEIYVSAREIVDMVRRNGIDPRDYLSKGSEQIRFDSYEELVSRLNDFVGENGKYTPLVKAVTLYMKNEEFKGLSIVDTPGLNDPIASRTIRTKEFMEVCDVVFFLSQAGSFLDKSDWTLLSSQLPQKGVKKLVLIASKYDSGVRDVLRKQDDDDIFGDDDNTSDNIPGACKIIKRKLKKRAKSKVEEFISDLEYRGSDRELIEVIRQCTDPIMVSSIVYNMTNKEANDYNSEEQNIYKALSMFSDDIQSDMKLLGNFETVYQLFDDVVHEKERILDSKSKTFVPNAVEEITTLLTTYLEKNKKRIDILTGNDREQLLEQKHAVEKQMGNIKADINSVFGELNSKIESEKASAVKSIRNASNDYLSIKERTGTKTYHDTRTVSDSKWWNPFSWGKSHEVTTTRTEQYSYCVASDAIENIKKYANSASSQVEDVFTEAINIKELKRKLLNIVVNNFDMGSEKYDSSLFRIMVEEIISTIEFPVFNIDISDSLGSITGKFNGEITSASQKTELSVALSNAVSRIYSDLCDKLESRVKDYKSDMVTTMHNVETKLLSEIIQEFDALVEQCNNKEKEIDILKKYGIILEDEIADFSRF